MGLFCHFWKYVGCYLIHHLVQLIGLFRYVKRSPFV